MLPKNLFWIVVLTFLSYSAMAQSISDWSGSFEGTIFGANATMVGKLNGDQWTGTISVSGYPVQFVGTVIDMECSGTMTDPQTKSTSPFTAKYAGKEISIRIHDINPISGQEENMEFKFFKTSDQQFIGSAISNSVTAAENPAPSNLDRSLYGLWRYTDTYVSGSYSFATDYFLQFKSDGTILITDGRTAGGGPTSSLDSGDGDTHKAIWKTENKILYTKTDRGGWEPYGQYYVEGHSLMLTYTNGNKQVWEKL